MLTGPGANYVQARQFLSIKTIHQCYFGHFTDVIPDGEFDDLMVDQPPWSRYE